MMRHLAHDLRSPLRIINGFSTLLMARYAEQLDGDGRELLQQINDNTVHMTAIIENLLSFSRITRSELKQGNVNLSALAQSILSRLQADDGERSVKVSIAPVAEVAGDGVLLELMLTNLLSNAWKFTSKRPDPRIEFGSVVLDNKTVYFVRDNGVGFDMEQRDRLFKPFQRLHATSEFPGTGIGLATAKRIIERHHGTIWVESVEEKGTTFYFSFAEG
jgi:signal transduction histidine kinase